jgi:hypothetical protein
VLTLGDNLTFIDDKSTYISMSGNYLNLNGKTVSGYSVTSRVHIKSATVGTSHTITVNGGTFANADFQDVAFANGGANLDLSGITGGSGDCGGNSMSGGGTLTFTGATTQTWNGTASGNWSTNAWSGHVPLPQDTVAFGAMSANQTITVDMPRIGGNVSFAGATNTPAVTFSVTWSIYGSLNLTGVGTVTNTRNTTFSSRTNATLTSAGKSVLQGGGGNATIAMPGATLTFADAMTSGAGWGLSYGTVSSAYSVTVATWSTLAGTVTSRTGGTTWTLTYSGTVWSMAGTYSSSAGSSIALTYAGATATSFVGGTVAYNNIVLTPGASVLTFSGAFSFANMTMSGVGAKTVKFTKSTQYTMTGTSFLSGTSGNVVTIDSDDGATAFTLSKSSGIVTSNYLSLKNSTATGGAKWYGANSTNAGNNSGWMFSAKSPGYVSASPSGYSRTNSFTFSWAVTGPDAALYANKYQYRISPSGTWIDVPGDATTSSISPTAPAYQIGSNVFYLRAVDITGNADPSGPQTTFYYNADAPSAPVALTANPSSSVTNSFSFSWTPPVTHSGNISGYYYSINSLPTITNSTFTTATNKEPIPSMS